MLTEEQLQAIEARANTATPGPWREDSWDDSEERLMHMIVRTYPASPSEAVACISCDGECCGMSGADAVFVAAARADVPALLVEVRRLRATLEEIAHGKGCTNDYGGCDMECEAVARKALGR